MATRAVNILLNAVDKASPKIGKVRASLGGLRLAISPLTSALAGLTGGFTAFVAAKTVVTLAGQFEQLNVSFTTLLGSGAAAKSLLRDIGTFTIRTPFQFGDTADAAKQLLAFGVAADDVIPTLRQLGDLSAGLGLNIQDLTRLYGESLVQGRVYTRDLRQFTTRGIDILTPLAQQFGVTKEEVFSLAEGGQLQFANLKTAIESLTGPGGRFFGLMDEQSKTLLGQWSNLKDAFALVARTVGQELIPYLKTALSAALGFTGAITDSEEATAAFGLQVRETLETFLRGMGAVGDIMRPFVVVWKTLKALVTETLTVAAELFALPGKTAKALTGHDPTPFLTNLAEELDRTTQDIVEDLKATATDTWPSDKVEEFFRTVRQQSAEAGRELRRNNPFLAGGAGGDGASLLDEPGKAFEKAKAEAQKLIEATRTPMEEYRKSVAEARKLFSQGLIDRETLGRVFADAEKTLLEPQQRARQKIIDDMKNDAQRIVEATRTPLEQLRQEIERIHVLFAQGFFGEETARRAVEAARKRAREALNKGEHDNTPFASGGLTSRTLSRGSGFNLASQRQLAEQRARQKAEEQRKKQIEEAQKQRRLMEQVVRKLPNAEFVGGF